MKFNQLFSAVSLFSISISAWATDFYVSPTGNDQANGQVAETSQDLNGPFQTLLRAKQAIRALKTSGQFNQAITVHIAPGNYVLTAPLAFDIRDSGVAGKEIIWQAETNAPTIISGGKSLNNCNADHDGLWHCPVKGLGVDSIKTPSADGRKQVKLPSFNLFVNQQALTLARWPDTDWAHAKIPSSTEPSKTFSSFEPLPSLLGDISESVIHIFAGQDYSDSYFPVASINQDQNQISLATNSNYPISSGNRYALLNLRAFLNTAGEWYYDRANAEILFYPPAHISPETITISSLPQLMTLEHVSNMRFQNMAFQNTIDTAITVNNSSKLTFDRLEISNTDNAGIQVLQSTDITVSNSHIHHTGQIGLIMDGGDKNTLQASNNIIDNNRFDHFGRILLTYSPGISISGVGSYTRHNLIEDGAGTGVTISGNEHVFEKNEVHHVCQQAADCGALYAGRNWTWRGNIIRYNSFHDIAGYGLKSIDVSKNLVKYGSPAQTGAVYMDDGLSNFTIFGNLFNNAGTMAILIGGGRDHIIQNNVFSTNNSFAIYVDNRWPSFQWSMLIDSLKQAPYQSPIWSAKYPALAAPMKHFNWPEGNTIEHNIIITHNTLPTSAVLYQLPTDSSRLGSNLYWPETGSLRFSYALLDKENQNGDLPWQNWLDVGLEKNSVYADPCAKITGNQVSFCADSAISKIDFQALPKDIGLRHQ